MAAAMIYLHEVHEVLGGKLEEFGDAMRTRWRPVLEADGHARLLWYWELTHGTGPSYQAVSIAAVRDWATWGALVADRRVREWQREACGLRRDVVAKILLPVAWSPLPPPALDAAPAEVRVERPAMYLHDTGWPFTGRLEEYVEALGTVFYPQTQRSRMITVVACWTVAAGTGRHHEVVLLQRIEDWERFARLLTAGEQGAQREGWMVEGLRYRDRWESKLLRCARWSPRQ
jgi:hypothetical protein